MRLKRLTISLFFILLFYFSFHYLDSISTNDTTVSYINSDNEGPVISSLSPDRCEQFIVAKPDIKINYIDESGIDTSSVKLFVNYKDVTKQCTITDSYVYYLPENKFKRGSQIIQVNMNGILQLEHLYTTIIED